MIEIIAVGMILGVCYKLRDALPIWYALVVILTFLRGFVRGVNNVFSSPPREEPETVQPGETENRTSNLPHETLTRSQAHQRKQKIREHKVFMDDSGEVDLNGTVIGWIDQTATTSQFCPAWDAPCSVRSSPEAAWHDATDFAETLLERR